MVALCANKGSACRHAMRRTLACRMAVEQRVNAALEDSSNTGDADASRRCFGAGFTRFANRFAPRRVRQPTDTASSVSAVLISRLLQPVEKTARSGPHGVRNSIPLRRRERCVAARTRHKQRNTL